MTVSKHTMGFGWVFIGCELIRREKKRMWNESLVLVSWPVCPPCQLLVSAWKQRCSVFASVSDCLVYAHFSFHDLDHMFDRFFSIFGFSLWSLRADRHLRCGIKLWADVLCVRGRECGSVCLSMCLYCHWGSDLCTCCYWPPIICWSRILAKANILVWWCWTNKHRPVNTSQGRYEGGELKEGCLTLSQHIHDPSDVCVVWVSAQFQSCASRKQYNCIIPAVSLTVKFSD